MFYSSHLKSKGGKNDTIVEKAKDAMKFNSWDEARSMIKVLESLGIYEGLPLYVQGMQLYDY